MELPGWELQTPECFKNLEKSGRDVVMVSKQYWSSTVLAQPPLLVLPYCIMGHHPLCNNLGNCHGEQQGMISLAMRVHPQQPC